MSEERKTNCGRELTCILCKHIYFNGGWPHKTDVTPAEPMKLECKLQHWPNHDCSGIGVLRETMLSAQTCEDFLRYDKESK